jgi:hypothetical protein
LQKRRKKVTVGIARREPGSSPATRRSDPRTASAGLIRNGSDTSISHTIITPLRVAGPDGVEGTVVREVTVLIERRVRAFPVWRGTVNLVVASGRRNTVLGTAGGIPPAPLSVVRRRSFTEQDGVAGPVGDPRDVYRKRSLQGRIIHDDPVVQRRRIGIDADVPGEAVGGNFVIRAARVGRAAEQQDRILDPGLRLLDVRRHLSEPRLIGPAVPVA